MNKEKLIKIFGFSHFILNIQWLSVDIYFVIYFLKRLSNTFSIL